MPKENANLAGKNPSNNLISGIFQQQIVKTKLVLAACVSLWTSSNSISVVKNETVRSAVIYKLIHNQDFLCIIILISTTFSPIDPFHNRFRIGLRFRLESDKESITRRPMFTCSAKMPNNPRRFVVSYCMSKTVYISMLHSGNKRMPTFNIRDVYCKRF